MKPYKLKRVLSARRDRALDEMREQHREKMRQQELEQDMLMRMQIEQKLERMRQPSTWLINEDYKRSDKQP